MIFIIEISTNRLVSMAETMADVKSPLPGGLRTQDVGAFNLQTQYWDVPTQTVKPIPVIANSVNPGVTPAAAAGFLKALLENPPTGGSPWTKLQSDQALFLLLLGRFNDFKSGQVF